MKKRHVFIAPDLASAERCVAEARKAGLKDEDISLIAKAGIQLDSIPEDLRDTSPTDFVPAAVRGAVGGAGTGLLIGLTAAAIPTMGVTLAGAAVVTLVGAAIGTWSSALVGAAIPNEVTQELEGHIEAGKILVVLDADEDLLPQLDIALPRVGARKAKYESISAMS